MENILRNIKNKKGVALLVTILLMSLILFLSLYFLSFSLTEKKIASSQAWGARTYYLAEAGIAEIVWRLKNEDSYKNNFQSNPGWTASFTRNNPFGAGSGSYTVTIANYSQAHGEITSTGSIDIGDGKTSQRIIKAKVYKPIGQSGIGESASYCDGNINFSSTIINYYNGNAHSNGDFIVNGTSDISIEGDLEAVGNYNKNWRASVEVDGIVYAKNFPPKAAEITMPAVDFNSNAPSSMKNRATVTYTSHQFEDLLDDNSSLTLAGVIYVNGNVNMRDDIDLTINGLLVINGDFKIRPDDHGHRKSDHEDFDYGYYDHHGHYKYYHRHYYDVINIIVNSAVGTPSGIMVNGKMEFNHDTGNININGVLYSTGDMKIEHLYGNQDFIINGGTVSRKLTITSTSRIIDIIHNDQILVDSLGEALSSPVLIVEHWEEEY